MTKWKSGGNMLRTGTKEVPSGIGIVMKRMNRCTSRDRLVYCNRETGRFLPPRTPAPAAGRRKITSSHRILTRDFLFIFVSHFLFSLAVGSLLPALPLYLARLSYTDAEIGLLTGIFAVAAVALRPFAGAALHRYSAKAVTVWGAFLYGLTFLGFLTGTAFWLLLLVRLAQGAAFALVTTASTAAAIDISPVELRGRSLSYFLLSVNLASVIGPALGIFFINRFSFPPFFVTLSVLCLGSLLAILGLTKVDNVSGQFSMRLPDFFSRTAVPAGLACFGLQIVWGTVATFFPLMAIEKGMANPGLFFTAMSVTMVICRTLGASILDRFKRRTVIAIFLTVLTADLVLLSFSSTQMMFTVVGIIFGVSYAYLIPSFMSHATQGSGTSAGAAVGTFLGLSDAGLAMGPMIMGAVAGSIGYSMTFLCAAFTALGDLFYSRFFVRETTHHHSDDP
jgi:MFS family permease